MDETGNNYSEVIQTQKEKDHIYSKVAIRHKAKQPIIPNPRETRQQ